MCFENIYGQSNLLNYRTQTYSILNLLKQLRKFENFRFEKVCQFGNLMSFLGEDSKIFQILFQIHYVFEILKKMSNFSKFFIV